MLDKSVLKSGAMEKAEIEKFEALANAWRDNKGPFKHVLAFNQCRFELILDKLTKHFDLNPEHPDLSTVRVLDVGCGAGILTEKFAELGARVTAIDASKNNIQIASYHSLNKQLNIDYRHGLFADAEDLSTQFDIVLCTEVIEHVEDQQQLINVCSQRLTAGGILVLATLNRTVKSYLFGIWGAEYILKLLPKGTHNWHYFVKPEESRNWCKSEGLEQVSLDGMSYNPFKKSWKASGDIAINYIQTLKHTRSTSEPNS